MLQDRTGNICSSTSGGTGIYTYQWYNTSNSITGATNSSYNPGNLTASTGYYCAVTSGSCGTVNTTTKNITVYNNLTSAISGGTSPICYNTSPGTFTATGTGGTGTYTYQWFTTPSNAISGATISSYNPGNIISSTGYYRAITSGSCGTVNTNTTNISVDGQFTSGAIGNAQSICYNTVPAQLTFITSPSGGTTTYTYQWYKGSGIIVSETNSFYAPAALTSGTTYYCAVTSGSCGTINSNSITITVYGNLTTGISGGTSPYLL